MFVKQHVTAGAVHAVFIEQIPPACDLHDGKWFITWKEPCSDAI